MNGVQQYYAQEAQTLAVRYESVDFEFVHGYALPFLPRPPGRALDVGSGTGRDATALAALGFDVTAVEPVPQMRAEARRLHPEAPVRWTEGSLPELAAVTGPFDLVLLSAVWMHLAPRERPVAMRRIAGLTAPGGRVVLSLRHGPVPEGRRMYDVPAAETTALAAEHGLTVLHTRTGADHLGRGEVHWSELVLERKHP
ncbi:class I SAM-dependent methyltransferase [Streptomyces sp. NPDC050504]|uniref:class I SAM-dependent methyltransferase n=1 Tax=Streptomyces sp. NPDC050504 TaxID=3365618 RepID=UPI003790CADA